MYQIDPIGVVRNRCSDPADMPAMKESESIIELYEPYNSGLYMTETAEYLDIIFWFHLDAGHRNEHGPLHVATMTGEVKGVFASRSPSRPNRIGVTTVRVIGREGHRLRVSGLDAVDGTPVIDIKACDTSRYENGTVEKIHDSLLRTGPRITIRRHIMAGETEKLLLLAGQMHGHFCPGLAMGVMAATHAMQRFGTDSDGLEDLLALVETNNCLSDGIQLVTGCSFGNNSLIFYDVGKTAFTLTRRDGKGLRIVSRPESRQYIQDAFPDFDRHYDRVVKNKSRDPQEVADYRKSGIERAFGTLKLDFDRLFDMMEVKVSIPEYAPSFDDVICTQCGESVMASRAVISDKKKLCHPCADKPAAVLDGHGIALAKYGVQGKTHFVERS